MRFQGQQTIEASRERAWAFLTATRRITRCAPEVQSLKILDNRRFLVGVRAGVGPIKGTFHGKISMREKTPPHS